MVWPAIDRRTDDATRTDGPELSANTLRAIRELTGRYPVARAAVLPALHLAQHEVGYLPPRVMAQVADTLGVAVQFVFDAASFYDMFRVKPRGRKLVQVCDGFACEACGQSGLLDALRKKLGIDPGQTTPDGQFTLVTVPCLAACDKAPVLQVNDTLFGPVTANDLDQVLMAKNEEADG